jgi:predicted XRE-type DNA-binding protein
MKNASQNNKPGHVTKGDIFDDLGFSSTESLEAKIKADIWQALMKHIERHGFSQAYLVTQLKVHQPDVSNLLKGKISKVSITKLIQFAGRLNLDARVKVTSPKEGKNIQTLRASSPKSDKSRRELIHA